MCQLEETGSQRHVEGKVLTGAEQRQFPFSPQHPAGSGIWERRTAPPLISRRGLAKIQKRVPVSRRRCSSNHGRDLWTSWRTFWRGPRQGGGVTSSPQPCPTPGFSAPFSLPCPLPSPALSPVRMLRQRLALFMQKVRDRTKN